METDSTIEIESIEGRKVLDQYLRSFDTAVRTLPQSMRQELRAEIISHISESMALSDKETEFDRLLDALERLGNPEKYMSPMIADYQVEFATSTFKPLDLLRAIGRNIGAGILRTVVYSIFFILYLTLFAFVFLFFAKIFAPGNTGVFYYNNEFRAIGMLSDPGKYTEKLGLLWYPLMIVSSVAEYFLITLLMKVTRKRRN